MDPTIPDGSPAERRTAFGTLHQRTAHAVNPIRGFKSVSLAGEGRDVNCQALESQYT